MKLTDWTIWLNQFDGSVLKLTCININSSSNYTPELCGLDRRLILSHPIIVLLSSGARQESLDQLLYLIFCKHCIYSVQSVIVTYLNWSCSLEITSLAFIVMTFELVLIRLLLAWIPYFSFHVWCVVLLVWGRETSFDL